MGWGCFSIANTRNTPNLALERFGRFFSKFGYWCGSVFYHVPPNSSMVVIITCIATITQKISLTAKGLVCDIIQPGKLTWPLNMHLWKKKRDSLEIHHFRMSVKCLSFRGCDPTQKPFHDHLVSSTSRPRLDPIRLTYVQKYLRVLFVRQVVNSLCLKMKYVRGPTCSPQILFEGCIICMNKGLHYS